MLVGNGFNLVRKGLGSYPAVKRMRAAGHVKQVHRDAGDAIAAVMATWTQQRESGRYVEVAETLAGIVSRYADERFGDAGWCKIADKWLQPDATMFSPDMIPLYRLFYSLSSHYDSSAREPKIVLDTSGFASWTRGSVSVGEMLVIDSESGAVILLLTGLVEAAAQITTGGEWIDLPIQHSATIILTDDLADWRMLAGLGQIFGSPELASAAYHALEAGFDILTSHSDVYAGLGGGSMALQIED